MAPLTTVETWTHAVGSTVLDFNPTVPGDLQQFGIRVQFHAHYDDTQNQFFNADPSMELFVGNYISLYVAPVNGFLGNVPGNGIEYFDPTFGSGNGGDVDVDTFFRCDGNPILLQWESDLVSYPVAPLPPGTTTNIAHFNWTLTLSPIQLP
jgi:hypothetical protein